MIAITLGLLISAAALMMFLSSQRSLAMQAGMGEIQQNAIFGLSALTHDLRHANLDTSSDYISSTQPGSGVIFDASQAMGSIALTGDHVTKVSTQKGSMNEFSDQLTIQYKARQPMKDCEGTDVPKDAIVIQRYYIAELPKHQQQGNTRYGLMCDVAGSGTSYAPTMGNGQQIVIPDAESFKVSFVTRDLNGTTGDRTDDKLRYQTLDAYKRAQQAQRSSLLRWVWSCGQATPSIAMAISIAPPLKSQGKMLLWQVLTTAICEWLCLRWSPFATVKG